MMFDLHVCPCCECVYVRVYLCKCSLNYVYCVCTVNVNKENGENKVLKIVARFVFVLHTCSMYILFIQ